MRKEHTILCNEVKGVTLDSFPGPEVFNALQGLSMFIFPTNIILLDYAFSQVDFLLNFDWVTCVLSFNGFIFHFAGYKAGNMNF